MDSENREKRITFKKVFRISDSYFMKYSQP